MYVMTSKDRLELETYRALGTPEEIKNRLNSPYPLAEEGYAPLPPMMPGEMPKMIGGKSLYHESILNLLKQSRIMPPEYQPVVPPITPGQRTAIDGILKESIATKPTSGLL